MALTDGLIHRWKFEETSGNRVDSVGSDDLSVNGADTSGPTEGLLGNGGDMVPDVRYYEVFSDLGLDLVDEYSLAGWAFPLQDGVPETWFELAGGASATSAKIRTGRFTDGRYFVRVEAEPLGNSRSIFHAIPNNFNANVWNHYAHTWKRNDFLRSYLNGVQVGEIATADLPLGTSTSPVGPTVSIGIRTAAGGQTPLGVTDEVMIWDRPLTAAEVAQLHNVGQGADLDAAVLDRMQTKTIRDAVYSEYPGVTIRRKGIDDFEWFDKRSGIQAPERPELRKQIGPIRGSYQQLRAYLDPQGTVLPATP